MQIGSIVKCINDTFNAHQIAEIPNRPVKGNGYTVRDFFIATRNGTDSVPAVLLEELSNPLLPHPSGYGSFEPSFAAKRFAEIDVAEMLSEIEEEEAILTT